MELEQAMKRIEELEDELKTRREQGIDPDDRRYIEHLKTDMRKAASARDESERRAGELKELLDKETRRHRVTLAAEKAGCVDARTFVSAMEAKDLPETGVGDEEFDAWFQEARQAHGYFFAEEADGSEDPRPEDPRPERPSAPLVPAGRMRSPESVQQLAAHAYRTS